MEIKKIDTEENLEKLDEENQILQMAQQMGDEDKISLVNESIRHLITKWRIPLEYLSTESSFSNSYIRSFLYPSQKNPQNYSYKFTRMLFLAVKPWLEKASIEIPRDAEEFFKMDVFLSRAKSA